jgi:hypothetical protein
MLSFGLGPATRAPRSAASKRRLASSSLNFSPGFFAMPDPHHLSTLRRHPDIARQIGEIMGDYASLEYQLFMVYAAIVTGQIKCVSVPDISACFASFYKQRAINNKTGLILTEARPKMNDIYYRALVRLCRRIKGAASRRTDVAHCIFMIGDGDISCLRAARPEPACEPLKQAYCFRTTAQFHTLGQDLRAYLAVLLGVEERWNYLLRALPLPPGASLPLSVVVPRGRPSQREKDEVNTSLSRLGMPPLSLN